MDFNEKKSFEELLREKVKHHEYPFESNSWAAMQNKLQQHQVQAAAQQSTLYKSLFLKAGKVFVALVSGSSIVYTALSLSGVINNKNENTAGNKLAKNEIVIQDKQQQNNTNTSANTATLHLDQNHNADANLNAANTSTDLENSIAGNESTDLQKSAATHFNESKSSKQNNVKASTKHFSASTYMQAEENAYLQKNSLHKTKKTVGKNNLINAIAGNNFSDNNKLNGQEKNVIAVNEDQQNPYIASDKNASVNENIVANENVNNEVAAISIEGMKDSSLALSTAIDSVITSPVAGGKYPEKPVGGKSKSNILFAVYAGLNFNQNRSEVDGKTLLDVVTPMFGFNATMPLSKGFAVQAGAQYLNYTVKNVSHSSAIVEYAILQDSSVTKTTFTQCKYIEFPVMLKYALAPRWNIYTGLRTSLLVGAKANFSTERYSNKKLVSSTPAEDGGKFMQYNGLRSVDFGIPFGVEFSVSKRISFSATANYGLSDFTINDVFKNSQKDKQTSLQLQLNIKPF